MDYDSQEVVRKHTEKEQIKVLLEKLNNADIWNDIDLMQSIVLVLMLKEKITLLKTFRMEHYM